MENKTNQDLRSLGAQEETTGMLHFVFHFSLRSKLSIILTKSIPNPEVELDCPPPPARMSTKLRKN